MLKTLSVLIMFSFLLCDRLSAQLFENFSDRDLDTNPEWTGTTDDFSVNADLALQLNSATAGSSWLSTSFSPDAGQEYEWEFAVRQSFAPSGSNFSRIYLVSDQPDVSSPLNGYFVQLGAAGSQDAVELFSQTGTARHSVCRASPGRIAAPFEIRVKVVRSPQGLWQLYVDYHGGDDLTLEAAGTDAAPLFGTWFGILCTYTITNATRFAFDDIMIRSSVPPDIYPPEVRSVEVTAPTTVQLAFSEPVAEASNPASYFVAPDHGNPGHVSVAADGMRAALTFSAGFENGYQGTIAIKDIVDLAGNAIVPVKIPFQYFVAVPVSFGDVVITEIHADPVPRVQLPDAEFVELHNRSSNPQQLEDWQFSDGVSVSRLPPYLLLPGQYVIVCPAPAMEEYLRLGPAIGVSGFPTLNNSGDHLILRDAVDVPVDSVSYSAKWYRDDDKAAGGWTLERIDPENLCDDESNWIASEAPEGGTPGKKNSVYASRPDNAGPRLIAVVPLSSTTLLLTFDEKLEATTPTSEHFSILPHVAIVSVAFTDGSLKGLRLAMAEAIHPGMDYTLSVSNVYDCPGNRIQETFSQMQFVLPEKGAPGDIVVNEVLFNPRPTGVDFIEIYNRSEKTIDLKGWAIRNVQSFAATNTVVVSSANTLLRPAEFRVFTEKPAILKGEYIAGEEGAFYETSLPGFNDEQGCVVILDDGGRVIDSMHYATAMHSPFLKDVEGVSLERISFSQPGSDGENWRSASSAAGFATPGYRNSNFRPGYPMDAGTVTVAPELIQPRRGIHHFAQIKYRFEHGGLVANIKIFDPAGRIIRDLASNELLGTEGFFRWDGDRDDGSIASTGYYFVWFETFGAAGVVNTYKRRVAVY